MIAGDLYDSQEERAKDTNVACMQCGQTLLLVNWIAAPFTGGYLKVTCPQCGTEQVLFDDYA